MTTSTATTMDVVLDGNTCLFHESYMERGFEGGQETSQLLLNWSAAKFPEIRSFSVYIVGDFSRLWSKTDKSEVNIHQEILGEFAAGMADRVRRQVQFSSRKRGDKGSVFSELVRQQTADKNGRRVLLGALSDDIRTVLQENPQPETITLLQTVESLESVEFDLFQKVSNKRIFRDRLCCAGM